jgi:hypothetical protein
MKDRAIAEKNLRENREKGLTSNRHGTIFDHGGTEAIA